MKTRTGHDPLVREALLLPSARGGEAGQALDGRRVERLLDRARVHANVICEQTVGSTNDCARNRLLEPEGGSGPILIATEHQTEGRGRMGRRWIDTPGGNLLFSLGLPAAGDRTGPAPFDAVALAAAVAVCEPIEHAGPWRPAIKWPNDVHLDGRKLAGILIETVVGADRAIPRGLVIGIGINVNGDPAELERIDPEVRGRVASLRMVSGALWDREVLLAAVAGRLIEWMRGGMDATSWRRVAGSWRARCDTLGRRVALQSGVRRIEGMALDLDDRGALIVRTDTGQLQSVTGGEVTIVDRA